MYSWRSWQFSEPVYLGHSSEVQYGLWNRQMAGIAHAMTRYT